MSSIRLVLSSGVVALIMLGTAHAQIQASITTTEGRKIQGAIKWLPRQKAYGITAKGSNAELEMEPASISEINVPRPRELDQAITAIKSGGAATAVPVLQKIATDYAMLQWDTVATRYLAEAHLQAGDANAALSVCESVIKINPEAAYLGEMAPSYWQALLGLKRTAKLQELLTKAVKSGDRRASAFALIARGDLIVAEGDGHEISRKALRDGYLRVITLYRSEREPQAEALYKAAQCFEKLGQTARADQLRTTLRTDYADSEWARKG